MPSTPLSEAMAVAVRATSRVLALMELEVDSLEADATQCRRCGKTETLYTAIADVDHKLYLGSLD